MLERKVLVVFLTVFFATASFSEDSPLISREFDWSEISPLEFLSILKYQEGSVLFLHYSDHPPEGWIKEEHVKELMRFVDSNEPAAPVLSKKGIKLPIYTSSVGNEAMYLIEGYRSKEYPPRLCSVYYFEPDREEYKSWWKGADPSLEVKQNKKGGAVTSELQITREEILKDSKPVELLIGDALILRKETFKAGHARFAFLLNRLTGKVEYVWANGFNHYVRPKYVMPNAQSVYDRWAGK